MKGGRQRVCISGADERTRVMAEYHDTKIGGHFGELKMLQRMQPHVYWPNMKKDINRYVKTCDTCQRTKAVRDKPQGLVQPIPTPTDRWEHVSVDLTGRLPVSAGYTAIGVVVDMFTKRVTLLATRHDVKADELAKQMFDNCFKNFGIPKTITSDRDSKFQSAFWQGIFKRMGTTLDMTTSYHPQADGQSERMIQTLKQYLTTFATYAQDTWANDLAMAEWCMNTQVSATTGMSPFYADTAREPRTPFSMSLLGTDDAQRVETVEQRIADLLRIRDMVMRTSETSKARQKKHADKQRREAEPYVPGQLVLVDNEVFRRDTGEVGEAAPLRKRWAGPYRIVGVDVRGNVTVDLDGRHSHNVFHPEKLQRFFPSPACFDARRQAVPTPERDSEGEEQWEVQDILDRRQNGRDKRWEYKVHWKGYAFDQASWVPESNLMNCRQAVDEFNSRYKGATRLQHERKRRSTEADPDSGKQVKRDAKASRWHLRGHPAAVSALTVIHPEGEARTDAQGTVPDAVTWWEATTPAHVSHHETAPQ